MYSFLVNKVLEIEAFGNNGIRPQVEILLDNSQQLALIILGLSVIENRYREGSNRPIEGAIRQPTCFAQNLRDSAIYLDKAATANTTFLKFS